MTGNGHVGSRVLVVEPRAALAALILDRLNSSPAVEAVRLSGQDAGARIAAAIEAGPFDTVVYSPLRERARDFTPELAEADLVLGACVRSCVRKIVLLSSAAAYGADYHNPGLIRESRPASTRRSNRVATAWRDVEALAARQIAEGGRTRLTILRPSMTLVDGATDWVNRLFRSRWAVTVAGYNPSIQLLSAAELAEAIGLAVASDATGLFNIAPDGVVPLHYALRTAGVRRLPLPWAPQWLARVALHRLGVASSGDQEEYLRYSWTVSNERSQLAFGMGCTGLTLDSTRVRRSRPETISADQGAPRRFDDFGMDEHFIRVRSRPALGFMERRYWRIEISGLEHVPREGRAVLVGVHRGFMPFDGVMMVHLLEKHLGRIPRFLMHPGLVKFPVLAPFLTNLGGIIACQENAEYVLERDEILGVFPEGIRGAFRMYREAYVLDRFGRSDFVKMALRHQAPIVPFLILGTAEMFPILARIEWSWWKRQTEWPFIPITPTFPLLPVPLPTKWHLLVMSPIAVHEAYPPEAADDAKVVSRIGTEVRNRMQHALNAMRLKRRSLFFGSIFDGGIEPLDPVGRPILEKPWRRLLEPWKPRPRKPMLWNSVQRMIQILAVLLGHAVALYARPVVRRYGWLARRLPSTELTGPERLRMVFEDLGGSFIKLGQMLAMQPDILPMAYCNALYDLLDHVNPVPVGEIARVIREETGHSPEQLFDRFDSVPLASGSIGQVHVAWKGDQKLAVKVQRPDAQATFDRDVKLMTLTVRIVRVLRLRMLSFVIDPLSEFASWTRDELDFRREARYMRILRRNAEGSDSQYVPFVLDEYTTRRVLVVEFLDGVTLLDHLRALGRRDPNHQARLAAMGFKPADLAANIIDNCLGDVFQFGVFHADLHPANLMILAGNVIGYIDFGITGVISKYSRQNLLAMTLAYARKDVDALCDRFFDVSSLDATSDPLGFREGVKRLAEQWYSGSAGDERLKTTTTQVMLDMLKLSRETRIWPQRDIIKYIRTSIAIDGLVRRFAPGFDFGHYLGTACRRHLTWHARRMLVSHDALVNSAKAGVDLVRDGVFRLAAALEHAAESPRRGEHRDGPGSRRASGEGQLFLVLITTLLLAVGTHDSIQIGPNLVTAELLVAAAAAVRLVAARRSGPDSARLQHSEG